MRSCNSDAPRPPRLLPALLPTLLPGLIQEQAVQAMAAGVPQQLRAMLKWEVHKSKLQQLRAMLECEPMGLQQLLQWEPPELQQPVAWLGWDPTQNHDTFSSRPLLEREITQIHQSDQEQPLTLLPGETRLQQL